MRVDPYRNRPVVGKRYPHVGAEYSRSRSLAQELLDTSNESIVQRTRYLLGSGLDPRGAVASARRCLQCELAHDHHFAARLGERKVHYPVAVVEYAQGDELACQIFDVFVGIVAAYADKHDHSASDLRKGLAADVALRLGYALNEYSHGRYR